MNTYNTSVVKTDTVHMKEHIAQTQQTWNITFITKSTFRFYINVASCFFSYQLISVCFDITLLSKLLTPNQLHPAVHWMKSN